ncbi:Lipopolysaccharide-induced tumor necrosis factor-alpha factor-like protein [Aphelenchoides besseyi]|nr:Lipopolysaccharide-induced tumor necrosis factor-alpha factor-like protein [Aphelenchoides besseyi]
MHTSTSTGNILSANKFDNTHVLVTPSRSTVPSISEPQTIHELGATFIQNRSIITPVPGYIQPDAPPSYSQLPNVTPSVQYSTEQRNVHVVVSVQMGPYPAAMQCPFCRLQIVTDVVNRAGLLTWLICCGLALVGCWPFCLIPFCLTRCQDVIHLCPNCKQFLGKYSRI